VTVIDIANVQHVYSGEPGCACGCLGDHRYPERHRDDWKELRGWGPFTDEDISDADVIGVTQIVEDILNNRRAGQVEFVTDSFISCLNGKGTRIWVVYLESPIPGLPHVDLYEEDNRKFRKQRDREFVDRMIEHFRAKGKSEEDLEWLRSVYNDVYELGTE
jgi:hypothetical protein